LEECCKEQVQLTEASKEGLGSKWAVVPMMMMIIFIHILAIDLQWIIMELL
jgi:hypothetical protein